MSNNKIQIAIYKLEKSSINGSSIINKFNNLKNSLKIMDGANEIIINDINYLNFENMSLHYFSKIIKSKWKEFFKPLNMENEIFNSNHLNEGIVFLFNSEEELFALTTGIGYFKIQNYIDHQFGIDLLSRLIDKNDKVLKNVKELNLVGGLFGSTKTFRNKYNLFENEDFGKFYKEIISQLDSKKLKIFGFKETDFKHDVVCIAKSSFKINKSINLDQLSNIIKGIKELLSKKPVFINSVVKVLNKELKELLENELIEQLFKRFELTDDSYDFDIVNYDIEKYYSASYFKLNNSTFDELFNIDIYFNYLREIENYDYLEFKKLIKSLVIESYSDEDSTYPITKDKLINHLFGDISYEDKKYFFVNGDWYFILDEFIKKLKEKCSKIINDNINNLILTKEWNSQREDDYNQLYLNDNSYFVLDKVLVENIEICDLLKIEDGNLYLIHIKKGFNNSMRDLCAQVYISATRIANDIESKKYDVIKKLYTQAVNGNDSEYRIEVAKQLNGISETDFSNYFKNNKIIFVLGIYDDRNRDLKQTDSFRSNIAKFSINELHQQLKSFNFEFKIAQIFQPKINLNK